MEEAINVSIVDSEFREVALNYDQGARGYALHARGGGAFQIKKSLSSTAYFTVIASTQGISIKELVAPKGATLCWAKSVSGAEVIEVVIIQNE